jgi:hypothetical protein
MGGRLLLKNADAGCLQQQFGRGFISSPPALSTVRAPPGP